MQNAQRCKYYSQYFPVLRLLVYSDLILRNLKNHSKRGNPKGQSI